MLRRLPLARPVLLTRPRRAAVGCIKQSALTKSVVQPRRSPESPHCSSAIVGYLGAARAKVQPLLRRIDDRPIRRDAFADHRGGDDRKFYKLEAGVSLSRRRYVGTACPSTFSCAGNSLRHRLPCDPREWTLDAKPRGSRERMASAGLRECEACGARNAPARESARLAAPSGVRRFKRSPSSKPSWSASSRTSCDAS